MFSAAWRPVAKIAVTRNDEAPMIRLRHAAGCQANRVAALDG